MDVIIIGQLLGISSVIGGFILWLTKQCVINPLATAIKSLQQSVDEFKDCIAEIQRGQHDIDIRLARVEESDKAAHHRISDLEQEVHNVK